MVKKITFLLAMSTVLVTSLQAQSVKSTAANQITKVDFDFFQRRLDEVHEPGYESWVINEVKESEKSFNGMSFKLKGNFGSKWYKVGMSAPYYNRVGSDGLVTSENLEMTIKGLKEGKHTLLTFHNAFDVNAGKKYAPIKIYLNGKLVETVTPSTRSNALYDASMAYINFSAVKGQELKIRFEMDPTTDPNIVKQIVVNGFELDTPNLIHQARAPKPDNGYEHVIVTDKKVLLEWDASKTAVAYNLYYGENKEVVTQAYELSKEYQGKLTERKFTVSDFYSGSTYYWRVDAIDAKGNVTLGNVWSFKPAQLAFPDAEGYGRFAIGGRGGKVVEVTNLNDDGPGSLRDAINQDIGPRTIVFNVSGNIELKSRLVVNKPYITIAGQTAPGQGITITRAPIGLTGNEGIIRFLKVRIGSGTTYDGMGLTGANYSIIDHCSISWAIDESFSSRSAHHITLQRTLISEALNIGGHSKYEVGKMHGFAATISGDIGSYHHNLLAHNYGRNWSLGGGLTGDGFYAGKLDIRNNVVYNWGKRTTDGGASQVNFVNNYYKPGTATLVFFALNAQHEGVGKGSQQYFFEGNVMPGHFDEKSQDKGRKFTVSNKAVVDFETFVNKPFFESYVTTQTAQSAFKNVISDVGASQPFLDTNDKRVIDETLHGTFTYRGGLSGLAGQIDSEKDLGVQPPYETEKRPANWDTDHDGLPDWWERASGLNPNSSPGVFLDAVLDKDNDGYSQLEDYLNWMALPHFFVGSGEKMILEAKDFFKGFENSPNYTVASANGGKAVVKGSKIEFTAPVKPGFASFTITVTDKDGDTMNRMINVFIK